MRKPASGEVLGKRYWRADDGSVYIDSRTRKYHGNVPHRIGHGGKHVIFDKGGISKTVYWDSAANAFTENDPTPKIREHQREAKEQAKTRAPSQAEKDTALDRAKEKAGKTESAPYVENNTDYSEEEFEAAKANLEKRLKAAPVNADAFVDLAQRLVTASTPADVRSLSSAIAQWETRKKEKTSRASKKDVAPEKKPETESGPRIQNEAEFDDLIKKLASIHMRPNRSPEPTRAAPRMRLNQEYLANLARRSDFYIVEHNSAATTGRGEPTPNLYASRAMPGSLFTQEQVDAVARRERDAAPSPEPQPTPEPGRDEALDKRRDEYARDREGAHGNNEAGHGNPPPPETPGRVARDPHGADGGEGVEHERPTWDTKIAAFRGLKPKTLDKLLLDPEDSLFFSMLVESLDADGMGLEIKRKLQAQERLTAEEKRLVNYARYEYARRSKEAQYIQGRLNEQDLQIAANRDQDLEAEIGLRGSERTLAVMKRQVMYQAMQNRESHERLFNTYANLDALRSTKRYRAWEHGVERLCKKTGTEMRDYDHVFKVGSKAERVASRRHLQEEMRSHMGAFRRAWDRVSGGSFRRSDRMVRQADALQQWLSAEGSVPQRVSDELHALTSVLRYTLVDNPEIDLMLQQEAVRNQLLAPAAENGPHTYAEAKKAEAPTAEKIRADLTAYTEKYRHADGRDWDHLNPEERTEALTPHRRAVLAREQTAGHGQGWFARAMLGFGRWLFDSHERTLINKPTLA